MRSAQFSKGMLVTTFFAAAAAMAQDGVGLFDVHEQALLNDPLIRRAEADFLANSEIGRQARSRFLPSLSLTSSISESHTLDPNPPRDFITGQPSDVFSSREFDSESSGLSITISQTLFSWTQYLTLKQADKTIARAEIDFATARQELMMRVATAYFGVLVAEDRLAADIGARNALEQQLFQTQRRLDVEVVPRMSVQEAQAGYDAAVATVIESENALASANESLRRILGSYITDLRSPIENLPLMTPDPSDVEAWVEIALGQNLSLIASRISADVAEDNIRIARSSRFPVLRLSVSGSEFGNISSQTTNRFAGPDLRTPQTAFDRESESFSLSLSVPIFSGGNRSRIQQSVYRHRSAIQTVELVTRETEQRTRDAYLAVTSGISRVEALHQLLESSRTALEATVASEEVGRRTSVDVVNAQNALRQAETRFAAARYGYLLDILRLKQAAGSLTEADILEIDGWLE